MRKLLNTLFVTSEDSYLALENENVVVLNGEEKKGQFPLSILEGIVCFTYKGASPALMGACAKRGVQLCFMTPNGRFLARACGESRGNVLLRKKQYRVSDDETQSCLIARNFIFGKVYNTRWMIERTLRDHALRVDADEMKRLSQQMAERLLGDSAQAEDAVQETVVRLWEMRDRLDEVKNIEGYCLTMLKRHCIDLLRQCQSHSTVPLDEAALMSTETESAAQIEERYREVKDRMRQLPTRQRKALQLKYVEGKDNHEIAKMLHMSMNHLYVTLSRACQTLRNINPENE